MKRCSISLIIRETQIKATMMYSLTLFRMTIIRKSTNNKCWRGCEEKRTHLHCSVHACLLSCFSHVRLFATLWTVPTRLLCPWEAPGKNTRLGCHALLQGDLSDPGFEPIYISSTSSGLLCPSPRDLPHPGFKPTSLTFPALAGATWEVP